MPKIFIRRKPFETREMLLFAEMGSAREFAEGEKFLYALVNY